MHIKYEQPIRDIRDQSVREYQCWFTDANGDDQPLGGEVSLAHIKAAEYAIEWAYKYQGSGGFVSLLTTTPNSLVLTISG